MWMRGSKVRSSSKNVARDHPLPILCAGRRVPAPVPAIAKYLRLSEMRPYIVAGQSSATLCLLKMPRSESHQQPSVPRPFRNRNRHPLAFLDMFLGSAATSVAHARRIPLVFPNTEKHNFLVNTGNPVFDFSCGSGRMCEGRPFPDPYGRAVVTACARSSSMDAPVGRR